MVSQGRTNVSELRERIKKLGGDPKGRTVADLLDELEAFVGSGDGTTIDIVPADVTQDDIDAIFDRTSNG